MVEEARLEDVGSGLAPVSAGWFVVNVADAAWLRNDAFGNRCNLESSKRPEARPSGHWGVENQGLTPGGSDRP